MKFRETWKRKYSDIYFYRSFEKYKFGEIFFFLLKCRILTRIRKKLLQIRYLKRKMFNAKIRISYVIFSYETLGISFGQLLSFKIQMDIISSDKGYFCTPNKVQMFFYGLLYRFLFFFYFLCSAKFPFFF